MPARILVVDDTELNLKMVSAILMKDGYEVITARNGFEALEVIKISLPALAILDVMMPDMDGYTLCQHFRQTPVTARIPIIILTALSGVDDKIKAFDSDADDFLGKPFEPQELRARVKVLLRRVAERETVQNTNEPGKVIGVFSLRGGVGVSMVASNLAAALAQIWRSPVILSDQAFVNGQSALLFDLPLRNTWADVGRSPAKRWISTCSTRHCCTTTQACMCLPRRAALMRAKPLQRSMSSAPLNCSAPIIITSSSTCRTTSLKLRLPASIWPTRSCSCSPRKQPLCAVPQMRLKPLPV